MQYFISRGKAGAGSVDWRWSILESCVWESRAPLLSSKSRELAVQIQRSREDEAQTSSSSLLIAQWLTNWIEQVFISMVLCNIYILLIWR